MKFIKNLLIFMMFILSLGFVSAIDLDDIQFTNEEFYNGAVSATKVLELSNGNLVVAFIKTSDTKMYGTICDLDGTNCGSAIVITGRDNIKSLDIFEDTTNNKIIFVEGRNTGGGGGDIASYRAMSLDLTSYGTLKSYDTETGYVSAVQTSSTEFAIAYQDTADSNHGKTIICQLDGSSCGTEQGPFDPISSNIKVIVTSTNELKSLISVSGGQLYLMHLNINTGAYISSTTLNTGGTTYIDMIEGSDNKLKIVYRDGTDTYGKFIDCALDGSSCGSEITIDQDAERYFQIIESNELLFMSYAKYDGSWQGGKIKNFNLVGGDISSESTFSTAANSYYGSMIFTTNNQILISYYDFNNVKGMFAISEQFTQVAGITINTPTQDTYYNSSSIFVNVTTELNTNLSYILNSGSEISLCDNCSSYTTTLTGIEGLNNLTILSEYTELDSSNSTVTFTIDTTSPVIDNNIEEEYNYYTIDGFNSSCSDINLVYCNISLNLQNVELNTSSFTFTLNGNITYTITSEDLAGNTQTENGTIFVNPYQYFYFQDQDTNPVTNFYINDIFFLNYYYEKTYDLGLGLTSLEFSKTNFQTETFNYTITNTSDFNETIEVNFVNIIVNIFDRVTGDVFTNLVEISISGLTEETTSSGSLTLQNISYEVGDYTLQAVSEGYYTEEKTFTYNGESDATINIYLLQQNLTSVSTLYVPVTDEWNNIISGADTRLQEYDSSILGFKEVSQCFTDSNGECKFLVEQKTKRYIITTSKTINNLLYTDTSSEEGEVFLPEISGGEELLGRDIIRALRLKLTSELQDVGFNNLYLSPIGDENSTIISQNDTNTIINVPVTFLSSNNLNYIVCFEINRINQGGNLQSVIDPICEEGSSGILPIPNINLNNDYDYKARVTIEYDNQKVIYKELNYLKNDSLFQLLKDNHYVNPFILLLWVVLLSTSLYLKNIMIFGIGAIFLSVIGSVIFPSVLYGVANVLIILINMGVIYLSRKREDLI